MLGRYSSAAINGISAKRTDTVLGMIKKAGGKVLSMYALLGRNDLALVVDFPGVKEAMKTSIGITKLTGIGFVSSPAITIKEFDKIVK
jgi:uncharacterized protein with GYD domain